MERFKICDACARHVRATESGCPFCGQTLADAALPPLVRAPAQLSRAQRIAFVAAIASGPMLAACGDDDMGKAAAPIAVPVYGAPVPPQQPLAGQGGDAGRNGGAAGARPMPVPVYGAPVPAPAGRSGAGAGGAGSSSGKPAAGAGGAAGQSGSGGSAGKPAAGSGAPMPVPVYGASPAYGLPPSK